jgi:hypothetical protein
MKILLVLLSLLVTSFMLPPSRRTATEGGLNGASGD